MTAHKDLKSIIRERQAKTGESYSAARAHVMRARAERLGLTDDRPAAPAAHERVDAIVVSVGERSARVRVPPDAAELTFRSADIDRVVPGHIATLVIEKRWTWREHTYASGHIENPHVDLDALGLAPLPMTDCGRIDLRRTSEPFRERDAFAQLWRKFTANPRPALEFDGIAWGAFPGEDPEECLPADAAELAQEGDVDGARKLLMRALQLDLRCIDAHAHLGNLEFRDDPARALAHYELGIRLGERSLPAGFDGLLPWGHLYNRPFLRCLHGAGLCLWRLGRTAEALVTFERVLAFNPNDYQGVRFCWDALRDGRTWEEFVEEESAGEERLH